MQGFFEHKLQKVGCTFALVLFLSSSLFSQMRGWEVGPWLGASNYFGDLNTEYRFDKLGLAGGALVRFNFNDRLAFGLGMNYAHIAANDANSGNVFQQRRNLNFKSNIYEGVARFDFNFLPYVHGHRDQFFTPYVFAGLSMFYYNPKKKLDGTTYELRQYGTEGQFEGDEYNSTTAALAYGLGIKYDINYRWSINVELSARKIFTDYLDDVSATYPDRRDLEAQRGALAVALSDPSIEPKIGDAGRQRGNGKKNDIILLGKVGLLYYFGAIRCPDFLR